MTDAETLEPWEVVDFPHFVGVRHRGSACWSTVILKPSGDEIEVSSLGGRRLLLDAGGIRFLPAEPDACEVVPITREGE